MDARGWILDAGYLMLDRVSGIKYQISSIKNQVSYFRYLTSALFPRAPTRSPGACHNIHTRQADHPIAWFSTEIATQKILAAQVELIDDLFDKLV